MFVLGPAKYRARSEFAATLCGCCGRSETTIIPVIDLREGCRGDHLPLLELSFIIGLINVFDTRTQSYTYA